MCAAGGHKVLVPDAASPGLVAHYTFDDDRAADSSGLGNHAKSTPMAGPGHGPKLGPSRARDGWIHMGSHIIISYLLPF